MCRSYLDRRTMWEALDSTIWRSLDYKLRATTISKKQGDKIAKHLYRPLMPRLGATRTLPLTFRYAPRKFQGLGRKHPYLEQGIHQVETVLTHAKIGTTVGLLIRCKLQAAQIEVGIGTPIPEADFIKWGSHLTESWIKSVWEFCRRHQIKLEGRANMVPNDQRENNSTIMETLAECSEVEPADLRRINRVRRSMKVMFLSDIASGDGTRIQKEALKGETD